MIRSLWIAKTGMDAQQMQMDVISNNLANVSTNGFKGSQVIFQDLLYQTLRQPGAQSSQQTQIPSAAASRHRRQSGGDRTPDDPGQPDANRQPVRFGDFRRRILPGPDAGRHDLLYPGWLVPKQQPGTTGDFQRFSGGTRDHHSRQRPQCDHRSGWHRFRHPAGSGDAGAGRQPATGDIHQSDRAAEHGSNLYQQTASSGSPSTTTPGTNGSGTVSQGYVETSNVNVVEEMVDMIQTQRSYEMNSKAITTTDQMLQTLSQM